MLNPTLVKLNNLGADMPFRDSLHLTCITGTETYVVEEIFTYEQKCVPLTLYYIVHGMQVIRVLPGFKTDFASIPKLFWNILPKDSKYIREASVIHDWLYTYTTIYTRKEADMILRAAMLELGANRLLANIVYWSVRLFGGSHWKETNTFTG